MFAEIKALVNIINTQVDALEAAYDGVALPPLNYDSVPTIFSEPKFIQPASNILAATSRLVAAVQNPYIALKEASAGVYVSAILNIAVEANITEALKDFGAKGLHINDLAQIVNIDASKLGRCLRYLCAHHIYREVSPDVFANNRLSMALDTGKPFGEVKDRDLHRYDNATGVAAFVGHTTDECLKGASILPKILLDSKDLAVTNPSNTLVTQAFGFDGGFFEWLEEPSNNKRLYRFGAAMKNMEKILPRDLILVGFEWSSLDKGALVVDVGAGLGAVTLPLAKNFPDLRFIVQDRPPVIADAEKFWQAELPDALKSGLVQLQGHNFFEPQPTESVALYILRHVLHDWADAEAGKILRHLRVSAAPSTKLLLLEQIVPYTCPKQGVSALSDIKGLEEEESPDVLQGNPGSLTGLAFMLDMQMLNVCNAMERTIGQWDELLKNTGWKIESVRKGPICSIVCKPI